MGQDILNEGTRSEIDKITWRVLRDAGIKTPPVPVGVIVEHMRLHRDFYDLQNPTFLDRVKHKVIIHRKRLVDLLQRIKLAAVLLYDEDRILIDERLPDIKHDWSTCHELSHRVLPWHKTYFRGDTAQTLNPQWHEALEAEANCAAADFMFCGPVFTREARDTTPCWDSVVEMKHRYGKSFTATLRRYVDRGPDHRMAMMVSTPYWLEKPEDQPERWRHYVGSKDFADAFSSVSPADLLALVDVHSEERRGGPVADFMCTLTDDNGDAHEFHAESFFNSHYILTLLVHLGQCATGAIVVPSLSLT